MGDTTTRRAEAEGRADIYQRITDQIAAAIEAGAGKWRMPWHPDADGAAPVLPVNAATGKQYRGTLLHGPGGGRSAPTFVRSLREADIARASEFEHAVQRIDGDGHFGCAAPVRA